MLTIVMYHYVRDLPRTRFPRIKGLATGNFEGQLDYISSHYSVCRMADVIAASQGKYTLPPNACVLTFDDGLADHYQTVLPRLLDRGFSGAFFPSARPIQEHKVLDVHKVQFILAAEEDHKKVDRALLNMVGQFRADFAIPPDTELWARLAVPGRFDPPETFFLKQMLQWALPQPVRAKLTDELFTKYVSDDQSAFAQELYMDMSELGQLLASGMEVGGHGYNHLWLGKLSREEQTDELRRTVSFLGDIFGHPPLDWTMCYPFGSYNEETVEIVAEMGCAAGLTTRVGLANCSQPLELERLDTNDLPVSAQSQICDWTKQIGQVRVVAVAPSNR